MTAKPVNIDRTPLQPVTTARGESLRQLDLSGRNLGVRIEELPVGGTSSEHHFHTQEEEHVLVLAGTATLHLGEERLALAPGDHCWFPSGDPTPHHIENDGTGPLRFLVFGERRRGDTVFYPERSVMLVKALGNALITYGDPPPAPS